MLINGGGSIIETKIKNFYFKYYETKIVPFFQKVGLKSYFKTKMYTGWFVEVTANAVLY